MIAMELQMANEETKSTCQEKNDVMFWSEHFLSKFGLEYIKHDVLYSEHKYKKKKTIIKRKAQAVQTIAQAFNLEADENEVTKWCMQFHCAFLSLIKRLTRRCLNQRWPFSYALLFAPPWVRAVELKVKLMSRAFLMERNKPATLQQLKASDFKLQLVENARAVVKAGHPLYGIEAVDAIIRRYKAPLNRVLEVWKYVCNNTKRLIVLEAECREDLHEVDWRVADLLLLYDVTFNIVTPASLSQPKQIKKLTYLFQAVVKNDVENELRNKGPNLLMAWMQVFGLYPFSYGFTSLVFIQRQWYELKYLARCQVLAYHLGRSTSAPHPLLLSIVAKYRHIVQEPFPKWRDLVDSELVVNLKDINHKIYKKVLKDSVDEVKRAIAYQSAEINYNTTNESKEKHESSVAESLNDDGEIHFKTDETSRSKSNSPHVDEQLVENINSETSLPNTKDKESECLLILKEQDNNICKMLSQTDLTIDSNIPSDTVDPKNEADYQIAFNISNEKELERRIEETDFNEILNVIDPTKAQKHLIFDSDSEDSASGLPNADDSSQQIDPKLKKKTIVPLVRCDQTPAWKKYFTNETINIRYISRNQLCPLKDGQYESINASTSNTLLRRCRTYSGDLLYSSSNSNLSLDGLPENFVRNPRNKRLFRLCRPLSVNLERMKLTCAEKSTVCRRAKKIQLPDIDEVRKINSTILTAEVAPVAVTRCAPVSKEISGSYSEENTMRDLSNLKIENSELDVLLKNLGAEAPNVINLYNPMDIIGLASTYIGPTDESPHIGPTDSSQHIGPMCETDHWNMESKQNDLKTNKSDKKCPHDDLTDRILNIIRNVRKPKTSSEPHVEMSHGSKPNTVDSSDSDDNLKLSIVIDKIKEKVLNKKRKIEQEKNLTARKKKKREKKVSEHSEEACSDDYDEWSRQKNISRKYFRLPNVSVRMKSQTDIQHNNPYAPSAYATVGSNVVLVANDQYNTPNVTTLKRNNIKPINKNANQQNVNLLTERNDDATNVIDLTDTPDEVHEIKETDQNENSFTPLITNVFSLAGTQTPNEKYVAQNTANINSGEQSSQGIEQLVPEMKVMCNTVDSLATLTKMPVSEEILPNEPQGNSPTIAGTVSSQQTFGASPGGVQLQPTLFIQPSAAQAQYTSEGLIPPLVSIAADNANSGRRFVIIPKSQLVNGNKSLLLPNMRIVNASITYNPVDHIQNMVSNMSQVAPTPPVPALENEIEPETAHLPATTFTPVSTWIQGKSDHELIILQVDLALPSWTLKGGHYVVTPTDYTCEIPIYCGLGPSKFRTRILFPCEQNGVVIYNPPTVQIDENSAIGDTPFANWVKSVLQKTEINTNDDKNDSNVRGDVKENAEPSKDPLVLNAREDGTRKDEGENNENAKPCARIKVKSFARLIENQENNFVGPSRVCLQGRLYMKVSDQPLKYAKIITAVSSFEEFNRLVSTDAPLWILPEGTTSLHSLQSINTSMPVLIPVMANNTP